MLDRTESALSIKHGDRVSELVTKLKQGTDPDVAAVLQSDEAKTFLKIILEEEQKLAQKRVKQTLLMKLLKGLRCW